MSSSYTGSNTHSQMIVTLQMLSHRFMNVEELLHLKAADGGRKRAFAERREVE